MGSGKFSRSARFSSASPSPASGRSARGREPGRPRRAASATSRSGVPKANARPPVPRTVRKSLSTKSSCSCASSSACCWGLSLRSTRPWMIRSSSSSAAICTFSRGRPPTTLFLLPRTSCASLRSSAIPSRVFWGMLSGGAGFSPKRRPPCCSRMPASSRSVAKVSTSSPKRVRVLTVS